MLRRIDDAKISDDTMMEFGANPWWNDGILRDSVRRESRDVSYLVPRIHTANLWSDEL